ncbi:MULTISPECIES: hypothetical protein [Cohaesibacter]|uniref:hypothetical protein n=1 Tax=Cohaesibacter TaxID=655352 RepID=UPI000DE9867A|nr:MULTISPECIES: hypothetical protein [Cohaesibacter]TLP49132.1 hypothetical protein FDK21_05765 [Cohaesibacter sp. CAU 1516]
MRTFLCFLFLSSFSFHAMAGDYVSSEAHAYRMSCNKDGYVLTSSYPVFRFIEGGAMSRVETLNPEKIYLGRSCDASHKVLGQGEWCWANGGFRATFDGHVIGFPRQEIYCSSDSAELTPCGC